MESHIKHALVEMSYSTILLFCIPLLQTPNKFYFHYTKIGTKELLCQGLYVRVKMMFQVLLCNVHCCASITEVELRPKPHAEHISCITGTCVLQVYTRLCLWCKCDDVLVRGCKYVCMYVTEIDAPMNSIHVTSIFMYLLHGKRDKYCFMANTTALWCTLGRGKQGQTGIRKRAGT